MEFAEAVEIDCSSDEVFHVISDLPAVFANLREKARVEVERMVGIGSPVVGDKWRVSGQTRLGRRTGVVEVTEITPPTVLCLRATARGFSVNTRLTIAPRSPTQCRLTVQNELSAMTFAARLLSPAIRLWQGRTQKRLGKWLLRLKRRLER